MTTGSSSPRSPEYSISALDLPTGETTTTTGTARPPGTRPRTTAQPDGRDADVWGTGLDDDDLLDLDPDPDLREPEFSAPDPAGRGFPDADRPGGTAGPRAADRREAPEADPADRAYGDPVGDLVRAAVADRPLEEVVDLITTLEQSPKYAQATVDALRAVGVNRSVEDVTRLVGLLTRPPRHPDSADEAIRAAAESRSVEDVTRLMGLLHRTSLEPHCGQAAVRAAATGRPVEELVELIGRLAEDGHVREESPDARQLRAARDAAEAPGADDAGEGDQHPPRDGVFAAAARGGGGGRAAAPPRAPGPAEGTGRG
ncbi:hypothetical protein ACFCWT_35640, partial [Streptomyces olivaceus]